MLVQPYGRCVRAVEPGVHGFEEGCVRLLRGLCAQHVQSGSLPEAFVIVQEPQSRPLQQYSFFGDLSAADDALEVWPRSCKTPAGVTHQCGSLSGLRIRTTYSVLQWGVAVCLRCTFGAPVHCLLRPNVQ
jgi:hypothetical protein